MFCNAPHAKAATPIYLLLLQFQPFPQGGAQFLHLSSTDSIPSGEARPKSSSFAHIFIDGIFKIPSKKALKSTVQIQSLSRHIRIKLSIFFFFQEFTYKSSHFKLKTDQKINTHTPAQWPVPLPSPPLSADPSRPSALTLTWFSLPESQRSSIRLSGQAKKDVNRSSFNTYTETQHTTIKTAKILKWGEMGFSSMHDCCV